MSAPKTGAFPNPSMYRLFDKHGTKFLAVVGSLLMLAFILPSNWTQHGQNTGRFGKIDGTEINSSDVRATSDAFHSLNNVIISRRNPQDPQGAPVPTPISQAIFPQDLTRQFQNNPVQWYLLVREARQAGSAPDEQLIESVLNGQAQLRTDDGQIVPMKDINPNIRDAYAAALREALSVSEYFTRFRSGTLKISTPAVNDALAQSEQQVRIRAVAFSAADYAKSVPAPTDDELKTQFKAYADVLPVETKTNPFGFGYRIPDRATLQWIVIPDSEVARAVEASKSAELWDEDAIIYYQKNQSSFQTATTQPTTRPFAEAKADVLKQLRQPLIDSMRRMIASRIVQQMQNDAKAASAKGATTQQSLEAKSGYGVPYGSFDYLQKLGDDIQNQFHVKLTLVNNPAPLSREQAQATDALGETYTDDYNTGANYLFTSLAALNPDGRLPIGQPSKILTAPNGLVIARAVGADPAHPPASLDQVRAQVEKDVREQKAFTLAADAANKAVADARQAGDLNKVNHLKSMTSDFFGETAEKIDGLSAAESYSTQLIAPAFDALRGVRTDSQLPAYSIAKLQKTGVAVALEVFDVKTTLNTDDLAMARLRAESQLMQAYQPQQLAMEWFSMDAISRRMDYTPDESMKKTETPPGSPAPAPGSPFLPG